MRSGTSHRARIEDLTETQRRVLDLIAEGKTNYEIGQALGITLDGAKYHVTEILNKLGVDSREAAAALARPGGGWSVRPHVASRSGLRRLVIGGAGVAAAGVAALILLALLAGNDSRSIPEIQAAFITTDDERNQQIVVVDDEGRERPVGPESRYGVVAWSPDADHLMALELVDAGLRLWIHPVASGDSYSWTPDGFESFEWSPDGKHLAVFAEGAVRIHDTRGREIAALTEQLSPKDQGNTVISTWSPDSHWVAALSVDERDGIRLLSLEGESRALPVPDGIEGDVLLVLEWVDDSRVQLFHMRPGVREGELDTDAWTRDISDSASNWEPSSATEPARWVTPEEAERVKERAAPGTRHVCTTPTADRGGVVYAFMPEDAINLSSIVVERDGTLTDITAPEGVLPFSLRPCVSVVLGP